MSANERVARAPAGAGPSGPSSVATGSAAASNAASAGSYGPREAALSTGESAGAASLESSQSPPPPPPPDTEDEETESEVELDMEADSEPAPALSPPPPPPLETPPPQVNAEPELGHAIDEPDSEEEDEEFPPVALTPRGSQVDEETKGGEDDEEEVTAQRAAPVMRRVEVEGRKQEGDDDDDEADDADDGDPSYEEDEEPRRQAGGRGREKTHVDVEPDTELLRLMAAEAGRMAAAEKKMPVWNDLAQKLSHRFRSGRALQARVGWLQVVLRDPSHGEHEHVTDEMKKLMKVYHVATGSVKPPRPSPKRRTIIGFKDPAKRRKLSRTDKPSLEERLQSSTSPKPAAKPSPDNRSADSSTPRAGSGPETPKNNQDEPTLDAVAEEKLMRMVVSLAREFVSAEDKMDVWTKIAAASRGRYSSGIRVRAHARWLVKVFRDPAHREHRNLTPTLKDLVAKFLRATDQPLVATGPTTPRGDSDKTASGTIGARDQHSKVPEEKSVAKRLKKVTIRPNGDSSLMQLVLEKRPFAASSTTTASIWTDIAVAMGRTHPKITDGPSALARLNTILKVFNDASHPNHNDFTKRLREQLSSYNQIVASFRANLNVLKRRVLHDDSSEASAEDIKIVKPRALGEGAELAEAPKPSLEKPRRTSRSAGISSASPSEINIELESSGYTGRKPIVPLNVEADELLLRVLLEKQPWTADRFQQGNLWKEVATAVQDLNPRIWNGVSAIGRVRWLQKVVSTPSHSDHGHLSSALRSMLKEFEELYSKRGDTASEQDRPPKSPGSSENETIQSLTSKKRKEAVVTETTEITEPVLPDGKRVRNDSANGSGATASSTSAKGATSSDEVLLWWALHARPFHSKRGDGMAAWDEVAVAADQALGQPTFRTGGRALSRLKRLLSAFRNPIGTPDIQLNERQRKMAELVATLLNTKWPSDETNLTDTHRHLQERIRQLLEEKTAGKVASANVANGVDTKMHDSTRANGGAAVGPKGPSAADASDDDFEMVILPRSEKELAELRSKLAEVNKQCDQLRAELESKKGLAVQAKLRRDQVNALQDEVIRLRSAAASDRASFETQLQTLHGEITSYRAQLASQAKRLDQEHQDHRDELRGIVAMLQSERAAHERDTATMLDVVHREREDRREEFVAMMNLVTRSVLQAEPAATLP